MIDREKVLQFVREKGPVLPRDVSKQFGADTFIMGAFLSSMVDEKQIKISNSKIGGSPVYYFSGQEEKLSVLFQYLPAKEKEAYTLLKEMKLIKDSTAQPAIRVALRNIKDFAKPIEVNLGETKDIFWKWHTFPNADAERAIREFFLPKQDQKEQKTTQTPQKQEETTPEQKKQEAVPEAKKETEQKPADPKKEEKKEPIKKQEQEQKKLLPEKTEQKEQSTKKPEIKDVFLERITKLFAEKNIEILETQIIKKNSEIEMTILISSPVGKLRYFCKARDKKKTNDKDLSSLFVQAQMKKMPALYITTGEIVKKAKEMIDQEFKTITVIQI
jgi:hypothetical protein